MTGYGKAGRCRRFPKIHGGGAFLERQKPRPPVRMPSVLKQKKWNLRDRARCPHRARQKRRAIHFEADASEARHELNGPAIRPIRQCPEALASETGQPTGTPLPWPCVPGRHANVQGVVRRGGLGRASHALVLEAADHFDAFRDTEGAPHSKPTSRAVWTPSHARNWPGPIVGGPNQARPRPHSDQPGRDHRPHVVGRGTL